MCSEEGFPLTYAHFKDGVETIRHIMDCQIVRSHPEKKWESDQPFLGIAAVNLAS